MLDLVGKELGRYHILERLGEGGMATVYKAFDTRLERHVAVKIIRPDVGQGNEMLKRFEREAKALAQLTHPNIVHINDYGEQGGMPYVVMDFLPGGTLKQKLGQPMPFADAARLLAPIARALEYAHQLKIIHRDVKPANILLTQSGAPMLSDFGIAKILEGQATTELTATGAGIGTPDYMAPEQWMGKAEARTDIYALGIVLYELIAGRRPYTADTPAAILLKHVNDPLPSPRLFVRDLPYQVEQVLNKALAKNIDGRFQTMGEFAARLEQLATAPRPASTQTVLGGPTQLIQPTGTNLKPPANLAAAPPSSIRTPVTPPPPPRPPTGAYSATGAHQPTGAHPITGPYPATGSHPPTGSYPSGAYSAAASSVGAGSLLDIRSTQRNPQLTWLLAGLVALVALCLVGGVAGGAFFLQQYNRTPTSDSPTIVAVATSSAATSPAGVTAVVAAGPSQTPPPPSSQVPADTPAGPVVPTTIPIPPIATAVGHGGQVGSVAFSPDGQWLASGSDDTTVRLWKWNGTSIDYLLELKGHAGAVLGVAFSPDGRKLASASRDNTVRVWAPQSAELLKTLAGHTAAVWSVAFSPDGRYLASGGEDGTVRLWNAGTGALIRSFRDASAAVDEQVWAVAFSPDAQTLVAAGTSTRMWSVGGPADQPLRRLNVKANGAAFSPDGHTFATGGGSVQIWDAASGQIQRSMGNPEGWEWSVAFSPDGQRVAGGNQDTFAHAWNSATGELQFTFSGSEADVNAVAFSPDARFLAGVGKDKVVRIWQVQADPVPTFTPWPPSATPTHVFVPPTHTRVPPTWTHEPPTWTPEPPTWTPEPPTWTPESPTPPSPVITLPVFRVTLRSPIFVPLATETPTPLPFVVLPKLTLPVIVQP